ncbi:hypothetical protein [Gillisia marina]|uniref:hypothetical protein n=1 Tax=Gillisia marina TaxID=1167637 RepID=UPI0002D69A59|nr:hypothetical protein [Gillisia marina]
MGKFTILSILLPTIFFITTSNAQESEDDLPKVPSALFINNEVMHISLKYSNKEIKKNTNDSTFITTFLKFKENEEPWDSLEVRLRRRGNFRLNNCYFAPIKVKIKKKEAKKTLFEGHKNLKLVLPCLLQRDSNDNIIKEYLAYKLYEIVSPYHFKTKLVHFSYEEIKGKHLKPHEIFGFLVEDDKNVAKRMGGKVLDIKTHPLNQMPLECVRNSFFQYMIGNTDYSTAYQHNTKLIFLENKIIPIPFDFDMCGMVNTSYATVSQINNQQLAITNVKERMYRGFKRDPKLFDEVRLEFLENRTAILEAIMQHELLFENKSEFVSTMEYIEEFFEVLLNDRKFEREIVSKVRTN